MATGPSQAINLAVKGELGRLPLYLIIYTRIFKYFLRLSTLQNNQILNCGLEINIHLNNEGKHSRFTTIRHLLYYTLPNEVIMLQICHIFTATGQFLTWLECFKEICLKNTRNIGRKI